MTIRPLAVLKGLGEYFQHPWLRLIWCVGGAFSAIFIALRFVGPDIDPFVLASLGGTTVFLFRLTQASAAQPRAVLGGYLGGAAIGLACYQCFGNALRVYCLAQGLTLLWMLTLRSVHPPAGTNPIIMVYAKAERRPCALPSCTE